MVVGYSGKTDDVELREINMHPRYTPEDEPQRNASVKRRIIVLAKRRGYYFELLLSEEISPSEFVRVMKRNRLELEVLLWEMK